MNFLPVLERELRARARKRGSYWTRSSLALVGMVTCVPLIAGTHTFGGPQTSGRYAFHFLVSIAFLLCCLGALLTSDAVRREHREGTLGLLFLTRVRGVDVVAAKMGSVGVACLSGLLALVPVLMLPVLAGGVAAGEAFRTGLALGSTLLLALSAGFWHVRPARWGNPLLRPAGLVAGLVLAPFLFWHMGTGPVRYVGALSPLAAVSAAADANYRVRPWDFWCCMAVVLVLAGVLLGRGSRRLQWLVGQGGSGGEEFGAARRRKVRWEPGRDDRNPAQWLFLRLPAVRALFWCGALVSVFQQVANALFYQFLAGPRGPFGMALTMQAPSLMISLIAGVFFAYGAGRFWRELRGNGELELVLTTGVSPREILVGQAGALQRLLWGPVLLMSLPVLLQMVSFFRYRFYSGSELWWAEYAVSLALALVNVALSVVAVCWLGLWFGYRSRSPGWAVAWTLGVGKLVPFGVSTVTYGVMSLLLMGSASPRAFGWAAQLLVSCLFVGMVLVARRRLRHALGDRKELRVRDVVQAGRALWWKARWWTPA